MAGSVLIDSIDFGYQESEHWHSAEGCLAKEHQVLQCQYDGDAFFVTHEGHVHHWRDFAGWTALYLEAPEQYGDVPLRLAMILRTNRVGQPTDKPSTTEITVEAEGLGSTSATALIPDDGNWHLVELDLPAGKEKQQRILRVKIDDQANISSDQNHYGKSITCMRLLAVSEDSKPGTIRVQELVDLLDVGIRESEEQHDPIGAFLDPGSNPLNEYAGVTRLMARRDICHFREMPRDYGALLQVPPQYVGACLELEVALMTYSAGNPEENPKPTKIQVISRTYSRVLAQVEIPDDGRFHVTRVCVPEQATELEGFIVRINDNANYFSHEKHYGKAVGYIRLTGDPKAKSEDVTALLAEKYATPDIVLVMCPVWDINMPPVALGSLASFLEGNGMRVRVHDFNIAMYRAEDKEGRTMWEGSNAVSWSGEDYANSMLAKNEHHIQQAANAILEMGAPVIGFSVATVNAAFSKRLAAILKEKKPDVKIVFGGPGIPFFPLELLGPDWDYLIYGAGERPLLSILRGDNPLAVGAITRENPEPYDPGKNRSFFDELDSLPLIHYSHLNLWHYGHFELDQFNPSHRLPMLTSRGCINSCRYCFDRIFYGPYSCLSGKRAFEQMKFLHERHGREILELADLLCNGDLDELRIMCELIVEAGLKVKWGSFAVMRPGMTIELMRLMASAGCRYLHYGFETGSQIMLKLMSRDYSVEDARESLRNTKKAGIFTRINIMVGFPGETERTVQETISFLRDNAEYIDLVETINPVYIMASTELMEEADKYSIDIPDGVPDRWETGEINEAKRREWVFQLREAVLDLGIKCNYSVIRGFTAQAGDDGLIDEEED